MLTYLFLLLLIYYLLDNFVCLGQQIQIKWKCDTWHRFYPGWIYGWTFQIILETKKEEWRDFVKIPWTLVSVFSRGEGVKQITKRLNPTIRSICFILKHLLSFFSLWLGCKEWKYKQCCKKSLSNFFKIIPFF